MFEAVLFDLDDTLLSWEAPGWTWDEIYARRTAGVGALLRAAGHEVGDTDLAGAMRGALIDSWRVARRDADHRSPQLGPALRDALGRVGIAGDALAESALAESALADAFGWEPIPGVVPFDEALAVLDALRAAGVRTGIVTNSHLPLRLREPELAALGLLERIDVCVTSGDVGRLKPHPLIYHAALDVIGVAPARAVFVGDRPERDIAGANAVGMTSVLFRPAYLPPVAAYGAGEAPGHVVDDLTQVLRIVLG